MSKIRVEVARDEHAEKIVSLIRELAMFEEMIDEFDITPELLKKHAIGEGKPVGAIVGYCEDEVVAYGIYFFTFSTFRGRLGIFVCLLYTSPSPRDATLSRMPSSA